MDQLNAGLSVALSGERATDETAAAQTQMKQWAIVMPQVEPLVLDFGLERFDEVGEIEFWIANEEEAGYCGKYLYMKSGQTCPKHMHKEKLETFFIVKGMIEMRYGERSFPMKPGDTLRVETEVYHEFTAHEPTLILEVSKPSVISDNFFADPRIPIGGNWEPSE